MRKELENELQRCANIVGLDDPYVGPITVGIHDVLKAHFLIADFFHEEGDGLGGIGPRDPNLLHSALSRQSTSLGNKQKWTDKFDICATLFFGLIKNHPFHDANKRTALLVALHHLHKLGRTPSTNQKEFETLTIRVAEDALFRYTKFETFQKKSRNDDAAILFVGNFFRKNTREINKKYYTLTYRELDAVLRKHGCRLEHPSGNYIDIIQIRQERKFWKLWGPAETREVRVGQIGFPGWSSEVRINAIKTVRECTGLTEKNGVDSEVFYRGAESLPDLLRSYHGPMKRLATR